MKPRREYIPVSQENVNDRAMAPEIIVGFDANPPKSLAQREIHGFRFINAIVEYTPRAINDLDYNRRQCLMLALAGLNNDQISETLGPPASTVRSRVQQASHIVGAKGIHRAGLLYVMSDQKHIEEQIMNDTTAPIPTQPYLPYVTIRKAVTTEAQTPAITDCSFVELDTLHGLARGETDDKIAKDLGVSQKTVSGLLDIIHHRLGTSNRSLLAAHHVIRAATIPSAPQPPDLIDQYRNATDPQKWYR